MRKKPSLKAADTANRTPAAGKAAEPKAVQKLELLVLVVNRSKAEFYLDFLNEFEINLHTIMPAHGTAKTEILKLGKNNILNISSCNLLFLPLNIMLLLFLPQIRSFICHH